MTPAAPSRRPPLRVAVVLINLLFLLTVSGGLLFVGFLVAEDSGLAGAVVQTWQGRQSDETVRVDAPAAMKAAVLRVAPVGTRIEPAQATLERRGFRCTPNTASKWVPWSVTSEPAIARPALDFLSCWRTDRRSLVTAQVWAIAVVHERGAVTDVLVNTAGEGP